MFGIITKQEIDTIQSIISAPLGNFLDFRDFCSNIHLNYESLSSAGHNIPELTRIDSFIHSIQPFTQFDPYLTTWTTANALGTRTLISLTDFLLNHYGDMPNENAPRGGNAFFIGKGKGKGKYKGKDTKGRGRRTKRGRDSDSDTTSLSSFNSSSSAAPAFFTDGISLIEALNANASRSQAISRVLTPPPLLALPQPTALTSNPPTSLGSENPLHHRG